MSTNKFTVADYLLTRLKEQGLDKIFQVPGDYVQEFMSALDKFDGIDAVGDITELGAGYAAEGYARYKGIGAVSVQYGVGTLSVINAIAGAYVERNPVVVITASPSIDDRKIIADTGALFHHSTGNYKSNQTIFESVTVASEILSDSETAPQIIDAALACAIKEKRPIYLEAWQNVWGAECSTPAYPLVITDTSVDLGLFSYVTLGAIAGPFYNEISEKEANARVSFPYSKSQYTIQYQTWWNESVELKEQGQNNEVYNYINRAMDWIEVSRETQIEGTEGAFISFKDSAIPTKDYFLGCYEDLMKVKERYSHDPANHLRSRKTII